MKVNSIKIPYAFDENGNYLTCDFDGHNFAMWIASECDATKSIVLNSMLNYLTKNYDSADVELWLFNIKEMNSKQISNVTKMLNCNTSNDLGKCLDEILEEMKKRIRLFSENGWRKFEEVPSETKLPLLMVVFDDFEMALENRTSQGIDNILKFEKVLRLSAAFGIKFIFSTLDYVQVFNTLTVATRHQINQRLALLPIDLSYLSMFLDLTMEEINKLSLERKTNISILRRNIEKEVSYGINLTIDK